MPLKWRIYNACATYLLVWGVAFSLWGGYKTMQNRVADTDEAIGITIVFLMFGIEIVKAILSLKAIRHYKLGTLPGKTEKVLFIIAFGFNILFDIGMILMVIFVMAPEFSRRNYDTNGPGLLELVLEFSMLVACLVSVYLAIADLILLKAIRIKQRENLMSFEIEINPEN